MHLPIVTISLGFIPRWTGPTQAERVMLVPGSAHWPLTIVHPLGIWVVSLLLTGFSDTANSVPLGLAYPNAFLPFHSSGIWTPLFWSPVAWHVQAPVFRTLKFLRTI